jgi:Thrombospondin type 3 repeat
MFVHALRRRLVGVASTLAVVSFGSLAMFAPPANAFVGESVIGSGTIHNIATGDGIVFCQDPTFTLDASGGAGTQGSGTWSFACPDGRTASGTIDCFDLRVNAYQADYAASAWMLGEVTSSNTSAYPSGSRVQLLGGDASDGPAADHFGIIQATPAQACGTYTGSISGLSAGVVNVVYLDADGDLVPDDLDNCPTVPNPAIAHFNIQAPIECPSSPVWLGFTGFRPPVDGNGVLNVVKAGSAIPVKFSLGGDQGLQIFEPGYPRFKRVSCPSTTPDVVEETISAAGSTLTYNASTDTYQYTLKTTKSLAGTCQALELSSHGTQTTALFQFR